MIWGLSLHGWEDAMRFSLAIVGIFGLIVGLSTWFVVRLQRAEIEHSREEFERYKVGAANELTAVSETAKADVEKAQAEIARANAQAATAPLTGAAKRAVSLANNRAKQNTGSENTSRQRKWYDFY